jgi:hypothetical protein
MSTEQGSRTRFAEVRAFLWEYKMLWLVPMVLMLLAFGGLMITAQSSSLGPFVYTLF